MTQAHTFCPRCGLRAGETQHNRHKVPAEQPCDDINDCVTRLNERVYQLESQLQWLADDVARLREDR